MTENTRAAFEKIVELQLARVEAMKKEQDFIDYQALKPLIIGVCGGDGIGPAITPQGQRVLDHLLQQGTAKARSSSKTSTG